MQIDTTNTPTPTPDDNAITDSAGALDNTNSSNDLLAPAVDAPLPNEDVGRNAVTPPEGGEAEPTDNKRTPWFQRRIDQLTAEKWEERRTAENLRKQTTDLLAQLAEARKNPIVSPVTLPAEGTPPPANNAPTSPHQGLSEAEINAMAEKRADEIARQRAFNKSCNEVAEAGKDEYPDFDRALGTFQMLGGIPTALLEVITEMPNAHKILYSLGKDPDLAERVVKMSPGKQALELARLENSVTKPTPRAISAAPPPVRPIDTNSRASDDPEKMSMEDFVKFREKHLAARKK